MSITTSWLVLATVLKFLDSTSVEFQLEFQWSYINYTWESTTQYHEAVGSGEYIPENIVVTGPKLHGNRVYLATPNDRGGVPFTLSYVLRNSKNKTNTPLIPFPGSFLHRESNCSNLQNVISMEIDPKGIMWVLDGVRLSTSNCPPKLQLLDLNKGGKLIHTYVFPDEVCLQNGGFLNDIVLDGEDYAYITDNSNVDPGLIVYSRGKNMAWKFRDSSMFTEKDSPKYTIDNLPVVTPGTIDGIALSHIPTGTLKKGRTVFYSALTGYNLFSVPTEVIRNETLYKNGIWRNSIVLVGRKQGGTDGMMMDNRGNLFYSLSTLDAIGRWNINQPFNQSEIFYSNRTMIWPDSFAIDQDGFLHVMASHAMDYFTPGVKLNLTSEIKFRIFKYRIDSKSYLYRYQ